MAELRVANSLLFTGKRHGTAPTRQIRERIGDHLCAFLCILTTLLLPSCSAENDPLPGTDGSDDNLVPVTISISAQDAAVTRYDDKNARDGGFMETLQIFVVDNSGKIEKIFIEEFDNKGCGTEYSASAYLTTGEKTLYAFANMDYVSIVNDNATFGSKINDLTEGTDWPADIDNCVIYDPAATVDFDDGKYIPMSVKKNANVTGTPSKEISLSLIRLVGRVDAKLENKSGKDITVTGFTMGGLPASVPLLSGGSSDTKKLSVLTASKTIELKSENSNIATTSFYVNGTADTDGQSGFPIELTINSTSTDGTNTSTPYTLTGTTSTKRIERNYILPLHLNIGNTLNLEIKAYIAPIGVYPITVYTAAEQFPLTEKSESHKITEIKLPVGCTFEITGKFQLYKDQSVIWTWNTTSNEVELDSNTGLVYGCLTAGAIAGKDITLNYETTAPVSMKGSLVITTEELKDLTDYNNSKSTMRWGAPPSRYEQVTLSPTNQ